MAFELCVRVPTGAELYLKCTGPTSLIQPQSAQNVRLNRMQ